MQSAAAIKATIAEIRDTYLKDRRPWVIGFSGGKDSTCTLQLVWQALRGLNKPQLLKPIYVISSDTLVESPAIVSYIKQTMASIERYAKSDKLPITANVVQPLVQDSFWVNMIGRGYPAPNSTKRVITDNTRGHGVELALEIQARLGLNAAPSSNVSSLEWGR
jgi:DNA sulfur modification protein DndC